MRGKVSTIGLGVVRLGRFALASCGGIAIFYEPPTLHFWSVLSLSSFLVYMERPID